MIDIDTRKVVDILDSREYEDVKLWLDRFYNLEIVSRDGSLTYAKAIKDSNSSIIQINDRFHLLKNLTDYCKEYIKRTVKTKYEVSIDNKQIIKNEDIIKIKQKYAYDTKWDLILAVKKLRNEGYSANQVCSILEISNNSVIKYSRINMCDKDKYDKVSVYKIKQNNVKRRKEELINEVKNLNEKGHSMRSIAIELGINRKTVKKYIDSNGTLIHGTKGQNHKSKIDKYKPIIKEYLLNNFTAIKIFMEIKNLGYTGSKSLLGKYISKIRKGTINVNLPDTKKIARKVLISLLYKDLNQVKGITEEELNKSIGKYPSLRLIYNTVKTFKTVLFSKEAANLAPWIKTTTLLNIPELNSFINGINRDIKSVENAITYKYSNGLAEGTVNKIKVIKRIMYGRCSFGLLRKKVLLHNIN